MKEIVIQQLQHECHSLRIQANRDSNDSTWNHYRERCNHLKSKIRKIKRDFYRKALSSKKPKEVGKVIHKIFHPNPQPLQQDPNEFNEHFESTAERVTSATPTSLEGIWSLIDRLPGNEVGAFTLTPVSCYQVLHEVKNLRSDYSCGPDDIPVKFVKLVIDSLASHLTHIVNTCISL